MKTTTRLMAAVLLAAVPSAGWAEVKLPAVFGENMVLQRSGKTAVYGRADAGEAVAVEVRTGDPAPGAGVHLATGKTVAGPDGRWRIDLDLREVPTAPSTVTVKGNNEIVLNNVLVGEVWLCGGQSNMEWSVNNSNNAAEEIKAANFPLLRLFQVKKRVSAGPVDDVQGKWVVCSPETVGGFSAVGYFFGRDVWIARKTPVGLISSNWGGTPAEAWTSLESLLAGGEMFASIVKHREDALAKDAATAATQPVTRPSFNQNSAAALYNGMIAPLYPTTLAGAIWYQGESNVGRAEQYRALMKAMVGDWRRGFDSDLTFLIVQLANFQDVKTTPGDDSWAELRAAQVDAAKTLGNAGYVVAFDIGEAKDIHPRNKQDVGKRLALQARKVRYGEKDLVASGPVMTNNSAVDGAVRITFDQPVIVKGGEPAGFQIAGDDRKWRWATAKVEGNVVTVSHAEVPAPTAVRYAWANNLPANLFNAGGLPVPPFRTDSDPEATRNNR